MKRLLLVFCLIFGSAESTLFAQSGAERISKEVASRIDASVGEAGFRTDGLVRELLEQPLTPDAAVRIALLNNKSLQALLESWGIARADFDKTRLPERPVFEAAVRFPEEDEPHDNVEFLVEQDVLSLILFPLKSGLAGAGLHKAELQITREVLEFAFEVKSTFYEVQGGMAMLAMRKRALEQSEASAELAKRQFEAGNISELKFAVERSLYQDAKLEYLRAETDFVLKKEDLNRLLGFGGDDPAWEIKEELREIQAPDPSYDELLSMGMSKRLDLLIARKNIEALRQALALSRFGMLGHPEAGVSIEKDVEGGRVTGPVFRTEVPVYDFGQTEISRSDSELKEAELGLKALENDARSEIKQKSDRLFALRVLAEEYKNSVIPVKEKITSESVKHQNYMLIGNYELIRAKQGEILARREYIDILKDYWIARSDLERAVSSKIPLGKSAEGSAGEKETETPTQTDHAHYNGGHHG